MWFDGMTLEELSKEYYLIPKGVKYTINISTSDEMERVLEVIDQFSDIYDKEYLSSSYIVRQKREKKLSDEEVKMIKKDKGSVREKAKKYNISIGTVSKINNDKY
ncbi:MAG: hypothetical protein SOW47_13580 [Clostridium perfringens]|nr:hypothetical protein [Clostridium perfringens]